MILEPVEKTGTGTLNSKVLSPFFPQALSMRAKVTFPNIVSLLIVLMLAVIYFGVFGDLDWSWQVRMGELIVQTGSLRPPESFSYTIGGAAVHDFEWLYELSLWATWSAL